LESKIYKKEDQIRQQESDINRLQRDVEVLRDSFNGSSSRQYKEGSSSYNDMESIMQGMEEKIQQL
jgi:uncharacterized protein YukE